MALAHVSWLKDGGGLPPEDDLCAQCQVIFTSLFSCLNCLLFVGLVDVASKRAAESAKRF